MPNEYNTAQVWPSIGRTKNDMIPIDITATVGEATSVLGKFVEFRVETLDEPSGSQSNVNLRPSAFDILLQASKSKCNLPNKVVENNKKDKLKNDLIDWLKGNGVGWSEGEKNFLGPQFVNTLSMVLWQIDGNHKTLETRGCDVPLLLSTFSGYNMPELKKKRKITADTLKEPLLSSNATSLLQLSNQAYIKSGPWKSIRESILCLATNLRKYCTYLKEQRESSSKNKAKLSFVKSERKTWKTYTETTSFNPSQKARYGLLHDALLSADLFEPICLNDFTPNLLWKKYEYLKALVVPCKTVRYTYTGGMENLEFAWRVPISYDEASLLTNLPQ